MSNSKKKGSGISTTLLFIGLFFTLVFLAIKITGMNETFTKEISPAKAPSQKTYMVEYRLSCFECDITYSTDSGIEQVFGASSGWTHIYKGSQYSAPYISAQNARESGTVTVSIWINGKKLKESNSSGPFAIAIANAMLD